MLDAIGQVQVRRPGPVDDAFSGPHAAPAQRSEGFLELPVGKAELNSPALHRILAQQEQFSGFEVGLSDGALLGDHAAVRAVERQHVWVLGDVEFFDGALQKGGILLFVFDVEGLGNRSGACVKKLR